jgi:hypothetical protein
MPENDDLLRRKAESVLAFETSLPEGVKPPEGEAAPESAGLDPAAFSAAPELAARAAAFESGSPEAVIRWYRPVLWVKGDTIDRNFEVVDPVQSSSQEILDLLTRHERELSRALPSIGRIELENNAQFEWVGTGWIVESGLGEDIVVTNAHVASEFAQRSQAGFKFRTGTIDFGFPQTARIDFRETVDRAPAREFAVTDVIWISDDEILDMALLRVSRSRADGDRLTPPIRLSTNSQSGRWVGVIGYPGDDSRSYDAEKLHRLFGSMFGTKRLAPGRLMELTQWGLTHDCSTLPGNSGSSVIDLQTGEAVGLHFSGSAFRANYAVPAAEILRILRERPWQPALRRRGEAGAAAAAVPAAVAAAAAGGGGLAVAADLGGVTVTIPLEISVRLGGPGGGSGGGGGGGYALGGEARSTPEALAERLGRQLALNPAVLGVEAGFLFEDGRLGDERGVVVKIAPGEALEPGDYGLAATMEGVRVAVETADPETVVAELAGIVRERVGDRTARYSRDLSDPDFRLDPITDDMRVILHVSPESGWSTLGAFLDSRRGNMLTIGMYHMTAPHIVEALETIAADGVDLTLTLDRQRGDMADDPDDTGGEVKKHDVPERDTLAKLAQLAPGSFRWAPAALGGNALFNTAYHIKVAVWSDRDDDRIADKAVWLSSGNWQSSNQPNVAGGTSDLQTYNREWHAVVEHPGLAGMFRRHLQQDYVDNRDFARRETGAERVPDLLVPLEMLERRSPRRRTRAFEPKVIEGRMTIHPLLTPDNYPEVVARLIREARTRVLIENQSFSLRKEIADMPPHFLALAEAVRDRQRAGLDVRIIFRNGFGKEREVLRRLKEFGIRTGPDDIRFFDTCHTKGIVVDDEHVVLGSQNWTGDGTGPNRDASLLITHPDANAYFAELFEHDWRNVAEHIVAEAPPSRRPVRFTRSGSEAGVPPGYKRVSLADFLGDS